MYGHNNIMNALETQKTTKHVQHTTTMDFKLTEVKIT